MPAARRSQVVVAARRAGRGCCRVVRVRRRLWGRVGEGEIVVGRRVRWGTRRVVRRRGRLLVESNVCQSSALVE